METDGVLIERSARGRPDAFVEVVQRHEVAVHGYLARRAGRQIADDLLGEVWVRAFSARDRYELARHDARPWLYGIARNVLRTYWRTNQVDDRPLPEGAVDPWDDVVEQMTGALLASAGILLIGPTRSHRDAGQAVAGRRTAPPRPPSSTALDC